MRLGGTLLLTNQRLIFKSNRLRRERAIVRITDAMVALRSHYMVLADIAGVSAIAKYPILQVNLINGQNRYYIVLAKRLRLRWNKKISLDCQAADLIVNAAKAARQFSQ